MAHLQKLSQPLGVPFAGSPRGARTQRSHIAAFSAAECAPPPVAQGGGDERVRGRTAAKLACREAATAGEHAARREGAGDATPRPKSPDYGYARNLTDLYTIQGEIGRGGNGVVTSVQNKATDVCYACKSIPKRPVAIAGDEAKLAAHMASVKREIWVMSELRSCLNVARLEAVFEDDDTVHIVQELCSGGELMHSIGDRHYSERTAASYMRAVLKTVAQCHAHNILHRDVKPGNFMLVSSADDARIKAIDFGLAVPFKEGDDLTNLDMQGTPWFLAPETLSSKWGPPADVWAAGIMAHQLLSGRLPFNDRRNPGNPALSAVLRSILTDKLNFSSTAWADVSDDAKDFVSKLLERDPAKRPSAADALCHPWLEGDVADRRKGRPLSMNVVQRIQRYGRAGVLKRSVYQLMAEELIKDDEAAHPAGEDAPRVDDKGRAIMDSPQSVAMELVLRYLSLDAAKAVDRGTLAAGLQRMGYRLHDGELDRLCAAIAGNTDVLSRAAVVASQLDWRYIQQFQKDRWLAIARRAFDLLDDDSDGCVSIDDLLQALQHKVPAEDVQASYEAALAAHPPAMARGISFRSFMRLLREPSADSLDLYDDRLDGTVSTLPTRSLRGGGALASVSSGYLPSASGVHDGSGRRSGSLSGLGAWDAALPADLMARSPGAASHLRAEDCSTHRGRNLCTVFEGRGKGA